ncbi:MAG: type II toxin-antitoxin system RelE/ParE family toxin [Paludibacter sp.]
MAKRSIVWTNTAVKQRREVLKYWTIKNGSSIYAEKLIKLIKERVNVISKNPTAFKLTTFQDVRVSALGHFSIYYKFTEQELIVVAFWDNRQDPTKLLEKIKS